MFLEMLSLKGKKALVTGSSRGIGKSIAFALGEAGAFVYFHASRPSERLDATVREAEEAGISCGKLTGDLSLTETPGILAREAGDIDCLILNASVQEYRKINEFDFAEFDREYHTNVGSSFALIKEFLPGMKERKFGRILSIGSVNQWKQSPNLTIYASTKSALVNVIMNCARSLAPFNITCNNIAPGVIATDRNKEALANAETREMILGKIPAGRFGKADDCALLALLLCSEGGAYITGADIPVAGGMQL